MLPVLLLIIVRVVTALRQAQLKGNLIFETEHQSLVTINPTYIQFNRQFDLSHVKEAITLLDNYTASYEEYCDDIQKDRKRVYDMFHTESSLDTGEKSCKDKHGLLPEVTSETEADRLMELMKLINIKETPAGIIKENETLKYMRTGLNNKYDQYKPCETCAINPYLPSVKNANGELFLYAFDENNKLFIKSSKCTQKCAKVTIICTKGTEFDDSILNKLATQSCIRDTKFIKETNKWLLKEYESFAHATSNSLKRRKKRAPPRRRKRWLKFAGIGGAVGGGFIANAIGFNPFHSIGEIVGGAFGIATARDLKLTRDMIKKVSQGLESVKINQRAIVEAINGMAAHSLSLEKMIRFQTHDVGVMYGELDAKLSMRYLQSVIQMTLLKVHAAMVAARQLKPSPYVFGQNDLKQLAADTRYYKLQMTSDIDEVATTLAVVDDQFTFLVAVPLKEAKSQYEIYRIKQLPVFNHNKTYKALTSNDFYAINMATNEYIELTEVDYLACSTNPFCVTQAPIFSINKESPCEITTFLYSKQSCLLETARPAGPSFLNYGNITYYSVPEPLTVNVRCTINGKIVSKHESIDGMGSFQAHTGCTTQVTEQAQIRPMHIAEIHDLEGNSIFGVLKQFDYSLLKYPKEPDQNATTTQKPVTILEVSSFKEGLNLLFDINTNSTDVVRIVTIIMICLLIFLVIYTCLPSFRLWFNDCCSITKPHKYWGQKYVNVPHFVKIEQDPSHLRERWTKFNNNIRKFFTRTSQNTTHRSNIPIPTTYQDLQNPVISNTLYPHIITNAI